MQLEVKKHLIHELPRAIRVKGVSDYETQIEQKYEYVPCSNCGEARPFDGYDQKFWLVAVGVVGFALLAIALMFLT